eukprot:8526578-Pyramimonas_sp.AAC.1
MWDPRGIRRDPQMENIESMILDLKPPAESALRPRLHSASSEFGCGGRWENIASVIFHLRRPNRKLSKAAQ